MRLVLDAVGGTHAPVEASVPFANARPEHEAVLVGERLRVRAWLERTGVPVLVQLPWAFMAVGVDERPQFFVAKVSSLRMGSVLVRDRSSSALALMGGALGVMRAEVGARWQAG